MLDAIKAAILTPGVKVVSFDVFDTLLVRPVISPVDLFYIMERRIRDEFGKERFPFVDARRWAEAETRREMREICPHYEDVTLNEIYERFASKLHVTSEQIAKMKEIELAVEAKYLTPRKPVQELYTLAKKLGKTVIAASDVYLPGRFLATTLADAGYELDKLYVSSDMRKSKGRGGMYPLIIRDLGVRPDQIVHIGDNFSADVKMSQHYKIRGFHIPSPIANFREARVNFDLWRGRPLDKAEPSFRLMLGTIINDVFDSVPKGGWDENSLFNGNPYLLGHYGLGPLIFCLTKWFQERAIRQDADMAAFIARDGLLMIKVYELLKSVFPDAPPAEYVRTSRSACFFFDVVDPIDFVMNHNQLHIEKSMPAGEILTQRFKLELDDALIDHLEARGFSVKAPVGDFSAFFSACLDYGDAIFAGLRDQRDMAESYYKRIFKGKKRIALFDVGYSGRAQRVLSKFLPAKLFGYYLFSFESIFSLDQRDQTYDNFLSVPTNRWTKDIEITTGLIEALISEFETGSVIGFEGGKTKPQPMLEDVNVNRDTARILSSVQDGAMAMANKMVITFGEDLKYFQISAPTAMRVLNQFMNKPFAKDARMFANMDFSNGITGQKFLMIDRDEGRSHWKQGFRAIHAKQPAKKPLNQTPQRAKARSRAGLGYGYGTLGWRRTYTPIVRVFVKKLGTRRDVEEFDQDPQRFFHSLETPRYVMSGRILYP